MGLIRPVSKGGGQSQHTGVPKSPRSKIKNGSSSAGSNVDPVDIPLFLDLPWVSGYVFQRKDRGRMLPSDLRAMASSLLQELQLEYDTNDTCRAVLENQASLYDNQKSAGSLSAILFGFRFLDIACMVSETGDPVPPSTPAENRPMMKKTKLLGSTAKVARWGIASLSECSQGWPNVLTHLQTCLQLAGSSLQPSSSPSDFGSSSSRRLLAAAFRQLESISKRDASLTVTKALSNLDGAAFFINHLVRGRIDLPSTWKKLVADLTSQAQQEGLECSIPRNVPVITRLRQPLLLALAISPLLLLSDVASMSTNVTRLQVLRAWYHYGNMKPGILLRIERMLWRHLLAIGRGESTSVDALQDFLKSALPLVSLAKPESRFFMPSSGKLIAMPVALQYEPGTAVVDGRTDAHCSLNDADSIVSVDADVRTSDSETDLDVPRQTLLPGAHSSEPETRSVVRSSMDNLPAPSSGAVHSSFGGPLEIVGGNYSQKQKLSSSSETTLFNLSSVCVSMEHSPSVMGGNVVTGCSSVNAVTMNTSWRERITGDGYLFLTPDCKSRKYWPCFYDSAIADVLASLVDRSNSYQERHGRAAFFHRLTASSRRCSDNDGLLRALAGVEPAGITCIASKRYLELERGDSLRELLRLSHVLVQGDRIAGRGVERSTLSEIGSCTAMRMVVDYSFTMFGAGFGGNTVTASFMEFLDHARDTSNLG
ncbi:hypothetical protein VNI00_013389 [Paramarasmius palmivorus]|uniref:Uncharacterized protein n=1 Tax=Paramarasmius palmivorus TaxID=297713 RepID=A0AAW0C163_9AGAR